MNNPTTNSQAPENKPDLCYSSDGERYYDDFQSILHDLEVGSSYFVAEQVEPTINALSLGETIHEYITVIRINL